MQRARYFFHLILSGILAYQDITYPWHRQDILRIACVSFNLLAQMANVGFYQACITITFVAPHMGHDLIRAAYVAGVDREQMQ